MDNDNTVEPNTEQSKSETAGKTRAVEDLGSKTEALSNSHTQPEETDRNKTIFKQQRQLKIIEQLPKLSWQVLIVVITILFLPNLKEVLGKVNKFKGYGVEIELKSTFELYNKNPVDKETFKYIGARQQEQIINRIKFLQPILSAKTYKILWDDDHPINNIYVVKILEQIGFKIETASTSDAGLELLSATLEDTTLQRYDLIITDYSRDNPSDKNGLKLAENAKEIDYSIPIIFSVQVLTKKKMVYRSQFLLLLTDQTI